MIDKKLPDWFVRLSGEIERRVMLDDKIYSYRNISLGAGLGPNYVEQLLKSQGRKNPQISEFTKLCEYLNLSLVYVLTGVEMSHRDEEFNSIWARLDPDAQEHVMNVLRRISPPK